MIFDFKKKRPHHRCGRFFIVLGVGVSLLRERVSFPAMEKKPKDRRGKRRKHSRVFSGVFTGPLKTGAVGGGWGFRWAAKSAKSTAALYRGQKPRVFYGSNMIRPPGPCKDYTSCVFRWVARRHRPFGQPFNELCSPIETLVSKSKPSEAGSVWRGGARSRVSCIAIRCDMAHDTQSATTRGIVTYMGCSS